MANDPLEDSTQHYLGAAHGFGPVRDDETVVVALFGPLSRAGQKFRDTDLEDRQLKRRDQSISRKKWTSARLFRANVETTRSGDKRPSCGLGAVTVKRLRGFRFKVPNSDPEVSGPALCVIDLVLKGDYDGHAALGYTEAMQNLTEPQKKKTRPLVRLEAAKRFGMIQDTASFRWEPAFWLAVRMSLIKLKNRLPFRSGRRRS